MTVRTSILGGVMAVVSLCSLSPPQTYAQSVRSSPHFERLDGFSHNTILSIQQDRRGFLWIGTADGLNRYDGYEIRTYRHDPQDSTSLTDNTIRPLAGGPDGTLWMGTPIGLNRYDPASGHFTLVPIFRERSASPPNVQSLTLDRAGQVWFTVLNHEGLFCYDPATDAVAQYRPGARPSGLAPGALGRPFTDHAGRLWVLGTTDTSAVLHRYDKGRDQFRRVRLSRQWTGKKIAVDDNGATTWWTDGRRVGRFAAAPPHFRSVLSLPEPRPSRPHLFASHNGTLLATRDSVLWMGTDEGLYHADPTTGTVSFHPVDSTGTSALSNFVLALHEDRAGIVWVGTRSGLYHYDPNEKPFAHRPLSSEPGGRIVMAIADGAGDRHWIGTLGGGLVRLDRSTGATRSFRAPAGLLGGNRIWSIHVDEQGTLWLGTDAGLLSFDPSTGHFARHELPVAGPRGSPPVFTLVPDGAGAVWVGGVANVYRFDPERRRVTQHRSLRAVDRLTTVQALYPDTLGRLWIGTESAGLLRYHPATDSLVRSPFLARDSTGLAGQTVWTLRPGRAGRLWLGTDLGLVRYDPATKTVSRHYDPDTLPGAHVYSIRTDDRGRLWMGTNQGLVRYDPSTNSFRRYDKGDGTGSTEFNRRAAHKSSDGTLTFGGLNGLTSFNPMAIQDNPHVPPVALTEVEVFGDETVQTIRAGALRRDRLTLSHDEATVELAFAALSFTNPEKNQYAYRMEGFDRNWVQAGTRRYARYANLPPGDYTFRVRGSNNDGVWNEEGASLRIVVTPPFWQTPWFTLLVAATVIGLLYGAYRYRIAQVRRVERMRLRIASDLHDDVGSKLSSLALLSEMVRDRASLSEASREELTRIGRVARQLTTDLREIVWFVDPEHENGAMIDKMEQAAASLLPEINYTFQCSSDDLLGAADAATRRNVFLIYKEALNNVAQHAGAEQVEIDVHRAGSTLVLTVRDDGTGFDEGETADGHGLRNMHRRAAKIDAELDVESQSGEGTTVRLTVGNNVIA